MAHIRYTSGDRLRSLVGDQPLYEFIHNDASEKIFPDTIANAQKIIVRLNRLLMGRYPHIPINPQDDDADSIPSQDTDEKVSPENDDFRAILSELKSDVNRITVKIDQLLARLET